MVAIDHVPQQRVEIRLEGGLQAAQHEIPFCRRVDEETEVEGHQELGKSELRSIPE